MANEDELELQEALRRSLEQTNLQESQLADALAESVRTHDHEIAQSMHRHQLAQIEDRKLAETGNELENSCLSMKAELLSSQTALDTNNNEWQVAGEPRVDRPRYNPFRLEEEQRANALQNPNLRGFPMSADHDSRASSASVSDATHQYTDGYRRVPYRPPNLHISISACGSQSGEKTNVVPQTRSSLTTQEVKAKTILKIPPGESSGLRHSKHRQNLAHSETNEPLVVIDGQNVGCAYGGGGISRFRAKGVEVVLDFYFNQGIPAVAIVPRHKVDTRSSIVNDRVADDPELLKKLEDQGRLAFTPAGAHDDHFVLSYAMIKDIDIISNDRFQKEISEQETQADVRRLRTFLNEHLIPYTFIHGQFVPNPKQTQLGRSIHNSRTRHS